MSAAVGAPAGARKSGRRVGTVVARAGILASAASALGACASPGVPPGGPERRQAPRLVRVAPESGSVNVRANEVVFAYDAVVSETPRGGGGGGTAGGGASGLEGLVTVSPRSGSVAVDWRRDRIAVRPRRGFRSNVTYTVTVLPGIQDLRNNVRDTASVTVFSTGGPIARAAVRGVVFDWVNNRAAARAVVEATGADSVTYFAVADSVGRFVVPNVPAGAYLVRGTVDVNLNRTADPREAFDTLRATATEAAAGRAARDTSGLAIYAFVRDSVPATLTTITAADSVTLRLTFDRPLRPGQSLAGRVRVVGADSVAVAVRAVTTPDVADSAATGDSARAPVRRGTVPDDEPPGTTPVPGVRGAPPRGGGGDDAPALTRPAPPTELVVRLGAPLRPNAPYRVRVTDVRSLSDIVRTTERTFTTPRPEARTAAPAPTAPPSTGTAPANQAPASRPPANQAPASRPPAAGPPTAAPAPQRPASAPPPATRR